MIFDTGSNWLWIDSILCTTCPAGIPRFDHTLSSSFKYDPKLLKLSYGQGAVKTYKANDQICITKEYCDTDFTFMIVKERVELDQVRSSGLVGMSPRYYEKDSDLFIVKMKKVGAIKESIFSMLIAAGD